MNDWKEKKLVEVVEIRVSNVDKKIYPHKKLVKLCNYMDAYSNDYITNKISFTIGSADPNEIKRFGLKINDVIITKDSETPDDIAVPSVVIEELENVVCGYHLAILRPSNELDGKFLMFLFQQAYLKRYFFCVANGSTRYGLTIGNIEKAKIKFPPFNTQTKIASIIFTVDKGIEKTQNTIAKYKAIKQGMLNDLFTRGIEMKTGKLRPKYEDAPELYKESKLGWIPREWEIIKVEEFASDDKNAIVDGPFGSNLKTIHYKNYGIPIIQSGFVTSNSFFAENYLYVDNDKFQSEIRSKVVPGDIIMAKIGAQCGTCAILPKNHKIGILAGNCLKITAAKKNSNKYFEAYLHYLFETNIIYNIITTTAQPAVSMSSLKIMKIKYPEPEEQIEIAKRINRIKKIIESEQNYLHKMQKLKAGLMGDLLTGNKRVKVKE